MTKFNKILWGGVIALSLTACTTDSVFEDIDQQNAETGSQYQTNSFNDRNSGQYWGGGGLRWFGINYISPWDIWWRGSTVNGISDLQPSYFFSNGNVEDVTPYNIEVFAYAGVAYFDGDDDGFYRDVSQTGSPIVHDMFNNPMSYQSLYVGGQEVGNLARSNPFKVDAYPATNYSFRYEDNILHFPFIAATPNASPKYGDGFDFSGILSPQEEDLLQNYGKIFFYEVHVYDKITNVLVLSTLMHPAINTIPNGITNPDDVDPGWKKVLDLSVTNQLTGTVPTLGFNAPLYYFYTGLPNGTEWDFYANPPFNVNKCDSREIVFDVPTVPSEVNIDSTYKLKLGFSATGQTGWVNSALHLDLTSR